MIVKTAFLCSINSCVFECQEGAADLQVTGGGCVVDLYVGAVGNGQLEAVSEPKHRGSRVSLHPTADVGRVPLPRVHGHGTPHLWSICSNTPGEERRGETSIQASLAVFKNLLAI